MRLVLPLYRRVREHGAELRPVEGLQRFPVQIGTWTFVISVQATTLPGTTLDVWLIDCPALYDRPGIYTQDADEHLRFLLLTRAALETCQRTQWSPDIVHANDWQTALALPRTIRDAATLLKSGRVTPATAQRRGKAALSRVKGLVLDYFEVRQADTLRPAGPKDRRLVILAAARVGKTRLIDNLRVFLN